MMWLVLTALGGTHTVEIPFPVRTMFPDSDDRVCVVAEGAHAVEPTAIDDGVFEATCGTVQDKLRVCLTLLVPEWPERLAPLECQSPAGVIKVVPVGAFDPQEDIWDGVTLARADAVQATWRAEGIDYAAGILEGGSCGIKDGYFWIWSRSERKNQLCTLVVDGEDRPVPIRLVNAL